VDSPAAIVADDKLMTTSMRRLLKALQKDQPEAQSLSEGYNLELNPSSPVICQLYRAWDANKEIAPEIAEQIYDNACISAGIVDDFSPLLKRMNKLMEETLKKSL
jgi:TNF receptor-associated protein 1